MKVSDYVFSFLKDRGIQHVFMLPGGGAMHLVDSLGKLGITYISNLHEQACAICAGAYAQYKGDLGVALVTTGPGGTNTITGVLASWLDSVPCLFISGQVKRQDMRGYFGVRQMGIQEADIVSLVKPITKYADTVMRPESIRYHLEKAIYLAKSGRQGPVWLDIPLDVQASEVDPDKMIGFTPNCECVYSDLDASVTRAIHLLQDSERPVILIGNGARDASYTELFEALKIPALTTWKSIDFVLEDYPYYCGRPGAIGQRGANFTLQNSDFLLSIGARLDLGQTGFRPDNFAPKARKVIVDVDRHELGKLSAMQADALVCANASDFIAKMLSKLHNFGGRLEWLEMCKGWQAKYPVVLPEYWQEKEYVNTYVFLDVLSDQMSEGDLLVTGSSGSAVEMTSQAFRMKKGQRVINFHGLGSMGFGIASAIGACLASGKKTVCIEGDGSFAMNTQELETVKRLNLPIKFFVLNNDGYASIRNTQRNFFGRLVGCDETSGLTLPKICDVACAYGIHYTRILNNTLLATMGKGVLDGDRPVICEVMINPDQKTQPRIASKQVDGQMQSTPLEDMYPQLPRQEFNRIMGVSRREKCVKA